MNTVLAFAGSNSSTSINFKLVEYTISCIVHQDVKLVNMAHFPFPMYSEDEEKTNGFPAALVEFGKNIKDSRGLIISVNEHNSNPSAYFKNLIDWLSRWDKKFLESKKVLLMATSPGKRGATSSHEIVKNTLPRFGAEIIATFTLPSFNDNFERGKGILDVDLSKAHQRAVDLFLSKI